MTRRLQLALLIAVIPSALWFLGGYDFNERGFQAVALGLATLVCFFATLTYPGDI